MRPAVRRRIVWALALLALLGLTLLVGARSQQVVPPSTVPAIDNPGPQGLEAAYRYLSALGQARRLDAAFNALPADARTVISALPYEREVEPAEREALLAWVEHGGTLVLLAQHQRGLGGALDDKLDPLFVALDIEGREVGLAELGRDVKALLAEAGRGGEAQAIPAFPVIGEPLLAGVRALSVGSGRGFDPRTLSAVPLATAGSTPIALAAARGRGRIILLAGPDSLSNARLDQLDNLQLLANLGAHGPVYFDEFHHQPAGAQAASALARLLGPSFLAWLAAAACFALALSRRLGPPLAVAPGVKRTSRDYAVQLGRLYRQARAEPALLEELGRQLRTHARERVHLPLSADDVEVVQRLAQQAPAQAAAYDALCRSLAQAAARPPSPAGFAALSRAAARFESER